MSDVARTSSQCDVARTSSLATTGERNPQFCTTCGDVAERMRVTRLDAARALALCEDGHGARHTVEVGLLAAVAVGDEVLVHAGTAIA